MDKENMKKNVAANLRSVTQSCKGGVPLNRLQRDYRDLLGEDIPYQKLGHNTLESMLRNMPDVISLKRNELGNLVVVGMENDATAHIVSLVQRQKNTKKVVAKSKYRPFSQPSRSQRSYSSIHSARPYYSSQSTGTHHTKTAAQRHVPEVSYKPVNHARRSNEIPPRFLKLSQRTVPPKEEYQPQPVEEYRPKPVERYQRHPVEEYQPHPPVEHYQPEFSSFPPSNYLNFDTNTVNNTELPTRRVLINEAPVSNRNESRKKRITVDIPHPPLPVKKTAVQTVADYAHRKGLFFTYDTQTIGQRKKKYVSVLTLGEQKFKSYPVEKDTKSEAEEEAAMHAVQAINEMEESKMKYSETPVVTEEQIQTFVQRIEEIVTEKVNGIWSTGMDFEYKEKFNESLPNNWLTLVKEHGTIEVEVPTNLQVPKGACVLRLPRPRSGTTTPTSTSSKRSSYAEEDFAATTLSHRANSISLDSAPLLEMPAGDQWAVFVSYVCSTENIAVRLVDQAIQFADLSEQMKTYYERKSYTPVQVQIEKLYAAQLEDDDSGYWHRVLVREWLPDTKEVICDFVDEGDTAKIKAANLQELDPVFTELPYQALSVRLSGLEDYADVVKLEILEKTLLARTLIADVRDKDQLEVIMYDTTGDEDVNLNELIREITVEESLTWSLPDVGTTHICYLTSVRPDGNIYVRFDNPLLTLLAFELGKLASKFEELSSITRHKKILRDKMYVARYIDDYWYRAVLNATSSEDPNMVEVHYVDYGNDAWVNTSDICELELFSKFLAELPCQAVQCSLSEVPPDGMMWTSDATDKLKELAPDEEELIVKVDQPATSTNVAKVSLLKRNESAMIISINQTLAFNKELFSASESQIHSDLLPDTSACISSPLDIDEKNATTLSNNIPDVAISAAAADERLAQMFSNKEVLISNLQSTVPDGSHEQINDSSTPPPFSEIPDIDNFFDVFITMAASPSNFVVQPMCMYDELGKLMDEMQHFYKNEENLFEMHAVLLKDDGFYSALHVDKDWYRVRVKNKTQEEPIMLTVHFVDYGDYGMVPMSDIQPLYQRFRNLPCQAIKATLAGVKPLHDDWDAMECFKFQEMVKEKAFVSKIKNKRVDPSSDFAGFTVDVLLIDTSDSNKDIYIHEILIEKKLAAASN